MNKLEGLEKLNNLLLARTLPLLKFIFSFDEFVFDQNRIHILIIGRNLLTRNLCFFKVFIGI